MIIKFPNTINEYTNGKLWREGTQESVARRILFTLDEVEDYDEFTQRRMYLAHFYYDIGQYDFSILILKELLLECQYYKEAILLLEKNYIKLQDVQGITEAFSLMKTLVGDVYEFLENLDNADVTLVSTDAFNSGKIKYDGRYTEYYKDGRLAYKFIDNDYKAFLLEQSAKVFLKEEKLHKALSMLDKIRKRHLKLTSILSYEQLYVKIYLQMKDYDSAYDHCSEFVQNGLFIPEIGDVLCGLKDIGSEQNYGKLRQFLIDRKNYTVSQLEDIYDVACRTEDWKLWDEIFSASKFSADDRSEERYILEGMDLLNRRDVNGAETAWRKANAIYGQYSHAKFYLYYLENCFDKSAVADGNKMFLMENNATVCEKIDAKLYDNLKKCKTKEQFCADLNNNLIALDNMLAGASLPLNEIIETTNNIYRMGYAPARSIVNRVVVDDRNDVVVRILCLANYLVCNNKRMYVFGEDLQVNKLTAYKIKDEFYQIKYGVAIFAAFLMLTVPHDNPEGERQEDIDEKFWEFVNKLRKILKSDYSKVKPYAVYVTLWAIINEDKLIVRDEIPLEEDDLILLLNAFEDDARDGYLNGKEKEFCLKLLGDIIELREVNGL